jgi:hypothetical protein
MLTSLFWALFSFSISFSKSAFVINSRLEFSYSTMYQSNWNLYTSIIRFLLALRYFMMVSSRSEFLSRNAWCSWVNWIFASSVLSLYTCMSCLSFSALRFNPLVTVFNFSNSWVALFQQKKLEFKSLKKHRNHLKINQLQCQLVVDDHSECRYTLLFTRSAKHKISQIFNPNIVSLSTIAFDPYGFVVSVSCKVAL